MASSGLISGSAILPVSTAPHKESLKKLMIMYLWASQSLGLYLRSVAFVRDAEPPLLLLLLEFDARWARSFRRPPVADLRRPCFLAIFDDEAFLMMKPAYGSVYTQNSGVWRSDELQKALSSGGGSRVRPESPV